MLDNITGSFEAGHLSAIMGLGTRKSSGIGLKGMKSLGIQLPGRSRFGGVGALEGSWFLGKASWVGGQALKHFWGWVPPCLMV